MTEKGDEILSDEKQYEEAVSGLESGDESAMTKVAFYKLSGRGGAEIDEEGAVALLKVRSDKGDDVAMWMLGLCYEYGIGTEQDIEQATLFYEQSSSFHNTIGNFLRLRLLQNQTEERRRGRAMRASSLSLKTYG